ncbi:MAG TPA: amidohydrolase family protein [Gemmatimonadaceae bacterium]|nr:amidohydrolase family protein [Gemmatimonadaceae bacterium]
MRFLDFARATFFAMTVVAPTASGQRAALDSADLFITRIYVVDVERGRLIADQTVYIKGDRIVAVRQAATQGTGARTIDGSGKYLIPGLWDMHAHLGGTSDPVTLELPLFTAHGVTGIRVMGMPQDRAILTRARQMQSGIAAGALIGPRILALATWAVNGEAGIADTLPQFYKARTREEGRDLARYFKESGYDFIKIYNNVSRDGYLGLTEEARRLNLPFAGHEPTPFSAIELSNAGQKSIEHSRIFLFNCFPGADSMRKGLLRPSTALRRRMVDEYDPRMCTEVFQTFARNGTYITPTHVTRRMDAYAHDAAYRGDARMKYIPGTRQMAWLADANGMVASDPSDAGRKSYMDFYRKGLTLTHDAYRAGVPVILGTDAGDSFVFPGSSVHDELGELVKAGLSPAEALRAATLTSAKFVDKTQDFGTIQTGRYADFVVLDANPLTDIANTRRIHAVVQGGRVFERAALDSMLTRVEVAVRPNAQSKLWIAAITGDTLALTEALANGAAIDSLDGQGNRRALNYAAINNRVAAVRFLVARGASINLANRTGFTPLHHAAEAGAVDALEALLTLGADASIASTRGVLPIDTARRRGDQDAVRLLEAAKKP